MNDEAIEETTEETKRRGRSPAPLAQVFQLDVDGALHVVEDMGSHRLLRDALRG